VDEIPLEAPPEDVVDQRAEVALPEVEDDYVPPPRPTEVPWDADPADVAEQHAEVPLADDDWS
jgi:hypothetical protein